MDEKLNKLIADSKKRAEEIIASTGDIRERFAAGRGGDSDATGNSLTENRIIEIRCECRVCKTGGIHPNDMEDFWVSGDRGYVVYSIGVCRKCAKATNAQP